MSGISSFINRLQILKQIPIFSKLNWFELRKIASPSILEEYKKGETICQEGSPPDYLYCLVSGRIQAYTTDIKGNKENIDFIHRGMHFGIISLFTGENHSMNFEAINDSVVLKIPNKEFQDILKSVPQLAIEFSQNLSKRIRRKVKGSKSIFESTIISVYSPVKGTGSSTYAINLAFSLEKETKKKVIFVNIHSDQQDLDEQQQKEHINIRWKIPPINLNEISHNQENIFVHIIKNELTIDILNVAFDPHDPEATKQISPFVSDLVKDYHYVIVDLPNEMDDVVFESLTQSDIIHVLTTDRKKDLESIRRVIDQLELILKENFNVERVRVIIRSIHAKIYLSFEDINEFIDYDVYMALPHIQDQDLIKEAQSNNITFFEYNPQCEYTQTIRQISRQIGGVLVGLALGGGAALGVTQIGVIRVLEEEKIPIDIVVGSSMGALIGSLWAIGKNSHDLEDVAREFEKKINMLKLLDPVLPISGLIGGRLIRRWLKKHLGNRTFYSVKIPFKAIAYDLIRREEIVMGSGSLVDAIRKSIAIPGVIEPVRQKDKVIIDGGVLNPLPTNVLTSAGIKKIIAVNVLQSPEDVSEGYDLDQLKLKEKQNVRFLSSPIEFITFRFFRIINKLFNPNISDIIVSTLQASEYILAEQSAQQADVVIHPDLVGIHWFELDRVDDLIKSGEQAARKQLPAIKKLIEE